MTPAGDVKVADFGLARVAGEDLELTHDGMTLGTPLYMSPEQGEGRPVDARSDLYSLGATVYHLLAGEPPFTGTTAIAVVMAHIKDPLVPLEERRPGTPGRPLRHRRAGCWPRIRLTALPRRGNCCER